mmetsp:Transcript_7716/g.15983  ORF Transcript_7716/g.15983 Transcript_7716/m.15983 type:complete len:125 (+) Transcript_7716:81-455(+)
MSTAALSKDELMAKSVKELKDMLRTEGFNPDELHGIEKAELAAKLQMLLLNPVEMDMYPLPLYSNCWPQFILRALLLAGLQFFFLSYLLVWLWNLAVLALVTAALTVRNMVIARNKATKRRKRT